MTSETKETNDKKGDLAGELLAMVANTVTAINLLTTGELLEALDKERAKFTKSDDLVMDILIAALIHVGEYPTTGNSNTVKTMVDGWGAYWHRWYGMLECPHCGSDWRDHKAGPPFLRSIAAVHDDRTDHYECPDCHGEIPRDEVDAAYWVDRENRKKGEHRAHDQATGGDPDQVQGG